MIQNKRIGFGMIYGKEIFSEVRDGTENEVLYPEYDTEIGDKLPFKGTTCTSSSQLRVWLEGEFQRLGVSYFSCV